MYQIKEEEKKAFVLAWKIIIWKKIWYCMQLYCDHNNITISTNSFLKSLKYNLLSPEGIANQMLPLLKKALNQGFLMPNEYKDNEYVKKAISLFGETFKLSKSGDSEYKLMSLHISEDYEKYKEIYTKPHSNDCVFCKTIESWDIEIGLYIPQDEYHLLLIKSILSSGIKI
jgi:hypothetical protein